MPSDSRITIAQYGTLHGHAAGKAAALQANPAVTFAGVYEPNDEARARAVTHRAYEGIHWYRSEEELLSDARVQAVAIEGMNASSLPDAIACARAGKHLWYDKPAGDDWAQYEQLVEAIRERDVYLQMGYMFRYQDGFQKLAQWVHDGVLGDVFQIRAHMSTWIPEQGNAFSRGTIAASHAGGILFDLSGHMLDQVLWLLRDERPARVTAFMHNHATPGVPNFKDNTLGVYEFARAMATIDIAAMEPQPTARRFEVYGTNGSAILDPMEPAVTARLVLAEARSGFTAGLQHVPLAGTTRQRSYELELEAFIPIALGERPPDRPLTHEILVQETLLRAAGSIAPEGQGATR